jgi:hypothetical protein
MTKRLELQKWPETGTAKRVAAELPVFSPALFFSLEAPSVILALATFIDSRRNALSMRAAWRA